MNTQDYWTKKHSKYLSEDWINKPTIFATEITPYLPKVGRLLDLGCGQGQDSKYFANLGYFVDALDFSEFALSKIIDKRINTRVYNFENKLDYPSGSFEVVYSHLGIGYFDEKRTAEIFDEVSSILKDGGVFVGLFNSIKDPEILTGEKISEDFYIVDGIRKRYFSIDSIKKYAINYKIKLLDNYGSTHKDNLKGVHNLVRFVGKKANSVRKTQRA